jgi:hypothetical protein
MAARKNTTTIDVKATQSEAQEVNPVDEIIDALTEETPDDEPEIAGGQGGGEATINDTLPDLHKLLDPKSKTVMYTNKQIAEKLGIGATVEKGGELIRKRVYPKIARIFECNFDETEIETLLRGHGSGDRKLYTHLFYQEVERYYRHCFDKYAIRRVIDGEVIGVIRYMPITPGTLGNPMLKDNPNKMTFDAYLKWRWNSDEQLKPAPVQGTVEAELHNPEVAGMLTISDRTPDYVDAEFEEEFESGLMRLDQEAEATEGFLANLDQAADAFVDGVFARVTTRMVDRVEEKKEKLLGSVGAAMFGTSQKSSAKRSKS